LSWCSLDFLSPAMGSELDGKGIPTGPIARERRFYTTGEGESGRADPDE
jgi:hypothetical protein